MRVLHSAPQLREEPITWAADFSSAFFLTAEKTSVEGQEELLVFDFEDLINGIGGALGLFLGWSILYLGKTTKIITIMLFHLTFLVTYCYQILPTIYNYTRNYIYHKLAPPSPAASPSPEPAPSSPQPPARILYQESPVRSAALAWVNQQKPKKKTRKPAKK